MEAQLDILQNDYHDFNALVVPLLPYPTALQFCKQASKGRPCLYNLPKEESGKWPALSWSLEDVTTKFQGPIEVAVTPSGNADSLISHPQSPNDVLFVEPATVYLSMKQLLSRLVPRSQNRATSAREAAYYLQSQNSNLTSTSLSTLLQDLQPNFDFAEEVLGEPDARNIWVGDERSVTSTHRDPYENLYLVLKGQKTFRLWAPIDEVSMPTKMVSTGRYTCTELEGGLHFDVELNHSREKIPWVDFDPLSEHDHSGDLEHSILGRMHQVTVREGQILYLPSAWYHHVTQECGKWADGSRAPCIAVNYWYDQEYEERYVLRQLVSRMVEVVRNA